MGIKNSFELLILNKIKYHLKNYSDYILYRKLKETVYFKELQILYLDHYNIDKWGELKFAYDTDSCFDLRAAIKSDYLIYPDHPLLIETGVKFRIPSGYECVIRPRSGLGKNGLSINYGTIDESYRGELKIIMYNLTFDRFTIRPGDRIAQCKMQKKSIYRLKRVYQFEDETERGEGGFGSSGVK